MMHDDDDDTLMTSAQVKASFGDVSDMWIYRRLNDDPDFPRPEYYARRRYWRRGAIAKYKRIVAARERVVYPRSGVAARQPAAA